MKPTSSEARKSLRKLTDHFDAKLSEGWPQPCIDYRGLQFAYEFASDNDRTQFLEHTEWDRLREVCHVEHLVMGERSP